MQSSFNKSQQLNYSNCKLSPIMFYPDTIHREKSDFFNIDNRNRVAFLQSSLISGKMGMVEPNLTNQFYARLKDLTTPLGEDSNMNSKKSGKENSQKKEEFSVRKIMPTFDLPWNTRNLTLNSNQNFKINNNFTLKTNQNSAFRNPNLGRNLEPIKRIVTPESRIPTEIYKNQFNNIQIPETNFFNNCTTNNIPQVFSSILKGRKADIGLNDVENISRHNGLNSRNLIDNNNNNNFKNERFPRNNLNLTIINNNNYNLKNHFDERKKKPGRGRRQNQLSENSSCEHDKGDEWKPGNYFKGKDRVKNQEQTVIKNEQRSKGKNNWKKVIEICREATEYTNNIYNNKLLNKKKSRVTETPVSSIKSKNFQDSAELLDKLQCLKEEKISTNMVTKRILANNIRKKEDDSVYYFNEGENNKFSQKDIESKRLFKNETKRKLKRYKKSGNINIKLENTTEKNIQVNHKYLFEPFEENPDIYSSCNFLNDDLKKEYTHYLTYGKSNENNLTFGDNPLTIYQNLAEWFNREIQNHGKSDKENNNKETLDLCEKIIFEMNDISKCISSLPIFMLPPLNRPKAHHKFNPYKKKKKFDDSGPVFSCEVCGQKFNSGQGLGGHMSRKHPKKSEKFQKKKEIRNKREEHRNTLYEAKKKLLTEFNLNYEELRKTTEGKKEIKEIVKKNKDLFKKFRIEITRAKKKEKLKSEEKFKKSQKTK